MDSSANQNDLDLEPYFPAELGGDSDRMFVYVAIPSHCPSFHYYRCHL